MPVKPPPPTENIMLKHVDLCSGIGGFALGLVGQNYLTLFYFAILSLGHAKYWQNIGLMLRLLKT